MGGYALPDPFRPLVTIARFQVPEEAHLFRTYVESRGIPAAVFDEHVVQLFWHYSNAIGGVRVVVSEEDVPAAAEAHREYLETLGSVPREPSGARLWPVVLLLSFALGGPLPRFRQADGGGPASEGCLGAFPPDVFFARSSSSKRCRTHDFKHFRGSAA